MPACSRPGSERTWRAPLASGTCSSGHVGLAGPRDAQQDWTKLKHAKASFAGTNARIAFGGNSNFLHSEEAKGQDLGHIREGAPERLYMGEERSRRAVGHPKLVCKSRQ